MAAATLEKNSRESLVASSGLCVVAAARENGSTAARIPSWKEEEEEVGDEEEVDEPATARSSSPAATSARCSPSPEPDESRGASLGGHIASDRGPKSLSTLCGDHGEEAASAAAAAEEDEATLFVFPAARLNVASTKLRTRSMNLSSLSLSSPPHSRESVS